MKTKIIGKDHFLNKDIKKFIFENNNLPKSQTFNKSDVIFTGRLAPDRLNEVIGAAWAMTFVPYFEGFGIPIVEAMKCDIPVIASKVTSLPEIAGKAALFVSPESPGSIRDAMIRIVREKGLREDLVEKGRARRDRFSWDDTAKLLWISMEKVLDQHA